MHLECFQQYGLLFLLFWLGICLVKCCVLNLGKPFIVSKCYLLVIGIRLGGVRGGGAGREVEGFLKAIILNYQIEQKEKSKHNSRHDAMGNGHDQKHNDQVFAHNLCENCLATHGLIPAFTRVLADPFCRRNKVIIIIIIINHTDWQICTSDNATIESKN